MDDDGVQILLGDGDGTFQPAKTIAAGLFGPLVADDFTGNGRLDLAVADGDQVDILLGNGDGTFQPAQAYAAGPFAGGVYAESMVAGDFNGDGHLDLAVAGYNFDDATNTYVGELSLLRGNGDGTFQAPILSATGLNTTDYVSRVSMVAGDFNGDGHLDLAVTETNANVDTRTSVGEVSVLLGNGDGSFQPPDTFSVGSDPLAIAAVDLTGDGFLDLAIADYGEYSDDNGTLWILLGKGDGSFQTPISDLLGSTPLGSVPNAIVAADFNGDGHPDLAVSLFGEDTVSVLLGNGDGTFTDPVGLPTRLMPRPSWPT